MAIHITVATPVFGYPERRDLPGIRRYSTELVKSLGSKGIDVRVVTSDVSGDTENFGRRVELVRIQTSEGVLGRVGNIGQGRLLAFGKRVASTPSLFKGTDLVHSDIPLLGIDTVRQRCPVVATVHHIERIRNALDFVSVPFGNSYGSYPFRRADAVVAPSECTALRLQRRFRIPGEKVHVIHHGVDTSIFYPNRSSGGSGSNPRTPVILFVGPMNQRKNVLLLLRAFRELLRLHTNAQLVLVGSGPLDTRIHRIIKRHSLESKIRRLTGVTDSQLRGLYNSADVYASASVDEGFGFSTVEAMACRTPLVVLETAISREVIGDAGVFVPGTSPDAWSAALASVLSNPKVARSLAERGYGRVLDRYSWDSAAQNYIELYQRLLKARSLRES